MNTGSTRFGRPSMGAWVTYGIGSESQDLPGFVVLQSGPRGPRGGAAQLGQRIPADDLPGRAVPIGRRSDPQSQPARRRRRRAASRPILDAIRDLNLTDLSATGDPEIATRIASYEMAYRMQTSGPGADRFRQGIQARLWTCTEPSRARPPFANNCLLARRLVERGVRFVQLYHTDWDHHADLGQPLEQATREVDQPTAALIRDLKQRGLLDHTLVVWGGEFGRTPMGEVRDGKGGPQSSHRRLYHVDGRRRREAGPDLGETDEFGFSPRAIACTSTTSRPPSCTCSAWTTRG